MFNRKKHFSCSKRGSSVNYSDLMAPVKRPSLIWTTIMYSELISSQKDKLRRSTSSLSEILKIGAFIIQKIWKDPAKSYGAIVFSQGVKEKVSLTIKFRSPIVWPSSEACTGDSLSTSISNLKICSLRLSLSNHLRFWWECSFVDFEFIFSL